MSDVLENKAVEILDKSQAAIASFADKLTEMAKQYGPDVADAALQMARIDVIDLLVHRVLWFALFLGLSIFTWKKMKAWAAEQSRASDGFSTFLFYVMVVASHGLTAAAVVRLFEVWIWVGIFEPKLWLAKRILGL